MKKLFNIGLIFTFVFVLFSAFNTPVFAEEIVQRKVIVHYHRYDGVYGDTNLWTWGTGTDGSEAPIAQAGLSDFGMTFEILIGDDADGSIGLIIRKADAWDPQPDDRDGIVVDGEVPNKSITIKSGDDFDGFDENGEKHVFVFEGQNHVMYQREEWGPLNEDFGTLSVIYFNPTGEYNGWRAHVWGTGTDGTGGDVFPAGRLGIDGEENELFRVWHFQIAANADDNMGFIMKDADWNKQCADDINIDISDIKGSGHKVVYYQAGACDVTTDSYFDTIDLTNFVVEEPEVEVEPEEPPRKVIVHYHRWDGNYTTENIWTWDTGTGGSEAPIERSGMSDFGATFEINIADNAASEIGFILRYSGAWGDGNNDRDGWIPADGGDKPNRAIVIKEDGEFVGFDENGEKHVFVFEGSNEIVYQDENFGPLREGFGTLTVVYFDPTQEYENWNVWNWGTGGTEAGDQFGGSGVPFSATIGVDGMTIGDPVFKAVHFSIAPDASDDMGFIVRTDAWDKQCGDDLFIDISDIKGSGFKTVFYIAGTCEFIEDFVTFEATANAFEIESLSVIGVQSFTLKFNKPVRVANEEGSIFDAEWFTLTDKNGNVVAIENINYISGANNVEEFTLFLTEAVQLSGGNSPYTVTFSREEGEELTFEFSLPSTPPTISIIGGTNITLQVGDTYSLPAFSATEFVNGENVPLFNVSIKEGHGYLHTGIPGTYEIIIIAVDRYNNVAERTITITVEGEESGMGALGIALIYVSIAVPVLAGGTVAFLKMRRGA
ncbi:pullulanase-associated domain-containing protein [Liberiplasma polymorphum]|uniref:pullulanase-associated domain-containing protein n=1 Tax=Liberiplasma polymorphum TaxID=3374570 RepID=UPI0037724657